MAVAAFKGLFNGECCGNKRMERSPSGRRRVFVQTETGCVLGIELDRSDNAHTVKRKLQVALNIPIEERSLVYGDVVLKNDLSTVRNDSPLLLTKNFMHRSSSTPCLSPTGKDIQQRDQSGPIEILVCSNNFSRTKKLVKEIVKAMKIGIDPLPVCGGLGGAYYFRNCQGENCAIVKPTDEEPYAPNNPKGFVGKSLGQPGLKRSVRVGETGFREVAAYLLDYDNFANVPSTALVKVTHSIFNVNDGVNGNKQQEQKEVSKIASLQQFIPHDFDASDHGTSSFPVSSVHRIGILDIRILNTDRHAGNLLVRKIDGDGGLSQVELVPIDHGLCLPENLEDPYFEWIHWPQASIPFSEDELEYISHLDPFRDSEMLRMELPMIREACLRVLVVCTIFLKTAAVFGLCLAEIGEMMSREFQGQEEEPSELEFICIEARRLLEERNMLSDNVKAGESKFQFEIDCEEEVDLTSNVEKKLASHAHCRPLGGNIRNPLSKLDENAEEWTDDEENVIPPRSDEHAFVAQDRAPTVPRLSMSMKNVSIGEKSWRHEGAMQKSGYLAGTSSGNRSVNEQLPGSTSFVKLADMSEEEWARYLEIFHNLLYPTFSNRKSGSVGQRQRQRLGTSCQF
ncbi:phosphatidylinositol 4-kinase gamma 5-like [Durio zibethinus]|uniref:1-phosphatidylinositol 4-kinase n=1 Tax=Durio zibethinus TaxID=66656 RepID=A0A6P6A4I9_DURZI|nr:phosphatidylinositol 4-kinase gamma 5-like [Durio zibethinus]XP_022759913.1 phosphatidylinositol 4-kinase gamma 5-like [Durio zibethinus]XP_022759914.1 phosphatidylinositol 4-kinase gamma 5-like [Durio zibethinus]